MSLKFLTFILKITNYQARLINPISNCLIGDEQPAHKIYIFLFQDKMINRSPYKVFPFPFSLVLRVYLVLIKIKQACCVNHLYLSSFVLLVLKVLPPQFPKKKRVTLLMSPGIYGLYVQWLLALSADFYQKIQIIYYQMALRIGALILASCQLFNASVIDLRGHGRQEEQTSCSSYKGGIHNNHGHHGQSGSQHESLPKVGIVLNDYTIGDTVTQSDFQGQVYHSPQRGAGHQQHESKGHSSDSHHHVNQISFEPLKTVELERKAQKAPITIVNIPSISTVPPTKHTVEDNQVRNQLNLPEHKDSINFGANKDLLSYNNILMTEIQPVKEVASPSKNEENGSSDDSHTHYHAHNVKPSNLEKKAEEQLAVGDAILKAPIVIRNYQVAKPTGHHGHHEHEPSSGNQQHVILIKEDAKTEESSSHSSLVSKYSDSNSYKGGHHGSTHGDHGGQNSVHTSSYIVAKSLIIAQPHDHHEASCHHEASSHHEVPSHHEVQNWQNGYLGNGKH